MDPVALNAAAVQAATEAMLAAGFGHFGGNELDDEDAPQLHGLGPAATFHLAAQHTATAASSLSALPSSQFFSSLRVGEGVDALDLIGYPQWRHAIVLDSRNDSTEFYIAWANWDRKWQEWVHCLRLAPAHSKVLGDTGPEDSSEKALVSILGNEWYQFLQANPGLLADVHFKMEGVAPWTLIQSKREAEEQKISSNHLTVPSFDEQKHDMPYSQSASPPTVSYSSLDPDEEAAQEEEQYNTHQQQQQQQLFSRSLGAQSIAAATSSSPASQTSTTAAKPHRLPLLTLYAHECFLRIRFPRLFKFQRQVDDESISAHDEMLQMQQQQSQFGLDLSRAHTLSPSSPSTNSQNSINKKGGVRLGSSNIPSAFISPPSARLAKSNNSMNALNNKGGPATANGAPSGSQTARPSTAHTRNGSGVTSTATAAASGRKSTGSVGNKSSALTTGVGRQSPTRVGWSSTPTSPPSLLHSASQPSVAAAAGARKSLPASSASPLLRTKSSGTASSARTPNGSAPATPKLKPSASPSPAASPLTSTTPSASPPATPSRNGSNSKFQHVKSKLNTGRSPASAASASTASPSTRKGTKPTRGVSDPSAVAAAAAIVPASSALAESSSRRVSTSSELETLEQSASSIVAGASDGSASVAAPSSASILTIEDEVGQISLLQPESTSAIAAAAAAHSAPSAGLFPSSNATATALNDECNTGVDGSKKVEECKEQPAQSEPATAESSPSPSPPPAPKHKLLVLPLSSSKALHAFYEYAYTDNIIHTVNGDSVKSSPSATASSSTAAAGGEKKKRNSRSQSAEHDHDATNPATTSADGHASTNSASAAAASRANGMSVLDLFELACLASSLHDTRLMALCALHVQRTLTPNNVMQSLQILDTIGALKHRQEREKRGNIQPLSIHLNGCLSPEKTDHATHPTQSATGKSILSSRSASSSPAFTSSPVTAAMLASLNAAAVVDPNAIPPAFLVPDNPATFLKSHLNLCGPSDHDFDVITRIVLDFLTLQWPVIFGSGDGANMKLLHSFPFETFSMVVNLRNSGNGNSVTGTGGSNGTGGGLLLGGSGNGYVFKSIEEKAVYNQAQVNAALIAAGIQPAPHHNLFTHAANSLMANSAYGTIPPTHQELLFLIASPAIALPPCNLLKVFKRLFDQPRNESNCDVRIVLEDDSEELEDVASSNDRSASDKKSARKVKAVIWAHKIVLCTGSEFFRTYFGGKNSKSPSNATHSSSPSSSAANRNWDRSLSSSDDDEGGVSTIRFPVSSYTVSSIETVLRYIYYNETRAIDFVTALYCMNQHVTHYFGLREYGSGSSSNGNGQSNRVGPNGTNFQSDLEKSCVHILHSSLSASHNGSLPPSAGDCLALIQSAYTYGDRPLFEKACLFVDYAHLDLLMSTATKRRRQEEEKEKNRRLKKLQAKNERNAERERNKLRGMLSPTDVGGASLSSDDDSSDSDSEDFSGGSSDEDGADEVAELRHQKNKDRKHHKNNSSSLHAGSTQAFTREMEFVSAIIAEKARAAAAAIVRQNQKPQP